MQSMQTTPRTRSCLSAASFANFPDNAWPRLPFPFCGLLSFPPGSHLPEAMGTDPLAHIIFAHEKSPRFSARASLNRQFPILTGRFQPSHACVASQLHLPSSYRPPSSLDGTRIKSELGWIRPFIRKKHLPSSGKCFLLTGNFLLSQGVSTQVSSASECLTAVFGMGTGGSIQATSPDILLRYSLKTIQKKKY